jgi:hypothetical protein
LVFEVTVFFIDNVILLDELINGFFMFLLQLDSKLLYLFLVFELFGLLEMLQLIAKCP